MPFCFQDQVQEWQGGSPEVAPGVVKILAALSNGLEDISLAPPYAQPLEIGWTSSHTLKRSLVALGSGSG